MRPLEDCRDAHTREVRANATSRGLVQPAYASTVRAAATFGEPVEYLATGPLFRLTIGHGYVMAPSTEAWVSLWVDLCATCTVPRFDVEHGDVRNPHEHDIGVNLRRLDRHREAVLAVYALSGRVAALETVKALLGNMAR